MTEDLELLRASKAWPVVEAGKAIGWLEQAPPAKGLALFAAGLGPPRPPHIGTFPRGLRSTPVRPALPRRSAGPAQDEAPAARLVPSDSVRVVILGTTDVHGRLVPWDYYAGEEEARGLARVATLVDSIRQSEPDVILVDSGDLLLALIGQHCLAVTDDVQTLCRGHQIDDRLCR